MKTMWIKCGLFCLFFPILASAEVKLRKSRFTSYFRTLSDHMWGCSFAIIHSLMVVEAGHMVASYTRIENIHQSAMQLFLNKSVLINTRH